MIMKVTPITSGMVSATTRPVRKPSERKLTAMTMITASTRARTKPPTASSTTLGWSVYCEISMPTGKAPRSWAVAISRPLPTCSTLAVLRMTTPIAMASLPRWRILLRGGSS